MEPIWQPSSDNIARSQMTAFTAFVTQRTGLSFASYQELHLWSVTELGEFWQLLAEFCNIQWQQQPAQAYQVGSGMQDAQWFLGGKLNFAQNLLSDLHAAPIIEITESGASKVTSRLELLQQVSSVAAYFRAFGLGPGDRVAAVLPNCSASVVAMLACSSIGAVWSCCSPDFGLGALLDRFEQITPKILLVCDGYQFKGKEISCLATAQELAQSLPSLAKVVLLPYLDSKDSSVPGMVPYHALLDKPSATLEFAPCDFGSPLYVLYSSGTTGKPKSIIHGVGGTLLQHQKELRLHTNIAPGDSLLFYTTCGWMMWHWSASVLACGVQLVLYDGCPTYPSLGRLLQEVAEHKVGIFGTSAKYLQILAREEYLPEPSLDLSAWRMLLATGSPVAPESYEYVSQYLKQDLCLASISGGTDLISCFALGNPNLSVTPGQLQCLGLGMAVQVYDENGCSVTDTRGELVCVQPFVSMPLGFYGDDDGTAYHQAYFAKYANVWAHGDYAIRTKDDSLIILGRSDAVLNPNGVRIGTAEIYRQVAKLDFVQESLAVPKFTAHDEHIVLFVVCADSIGLTPQRIQALKKVIAENTSVRHVPRYIVPAPDLPRTMNNKLCELAVRALLNNECPANIQTIANPECLAYFQNYKLPDYAS